MKARNVVKLKFFVILLFGIGTPSLLLYHAHAAMRDLSAVAMESSGNPLVREMIKLRPNLRSPDDYRLASQVLAESANQRTMINKQIMKMSAMHVGFATMSLGMMMILLGVKGNEEIGLRVTSAAVDFRKISTGALVFCVGAAITSAAALLPNQYSTVGVPFFGTGAAPHPSTGSVLSPQNACVSANSNDLPEMIKCLEELNNAKTIRGR